MIERIAEAKDYTVYGRGPCVAMVRGSSIGSTGYMTEQGLAYLVWRDGVPWLVSKGSEIEAGPGQVREIERFSEDLKVLLGVEGVQEANGAEKVGNADPGLP